MDEPESNNMWELEIIKLTNPSNFLARELPGEGKSCSYQEFASISEKMSEYLNAVMEQGEPPFKPSLYEICAAQKGDIWHRLRIDEFIAKSNGQKARCSLIDVGSEVSLNIARLHRLPTKFRNFPSQVHRCCLSRVQPLTMQVSETEFGLQALPRPSRKWDPSATTFMSQWRNDNNRCKAVTVKEGTSGILYLRLYFFVQSDWVNFNDELVRKKYAIETNAEPSESINRVSYLPGKPLTPANQRQRSNPSQIKTATSSDGLEMPVLSDFTDSDTQAESCDVRQRNNNENVSHLKTKFPSAHSISARSAQNYVEDKTRIENDSPSVFVDFLKKIPDSELAACPRMPKPKSANNSSESDSASCQTRSTQAMGGLRHCTQVVPGVGRGRAGLLNKILNKKQSPGSRSPDHGQINSQLSPRKVDPKLPKTAKFLSTSPAKTSATSDTESIPPLSPVSPESSSPSQRVSPHKLSAVFSLGKSSPNPSQKMSSSPLLESSDQINGHVNCSSGPLSLTDGPKDGNNNGTSSLQSGPKLSHEPRGIGVEINESLSSHSSDLRSRPRDEDKDETSQVLTDGLQSSASGAGVRLRERKLLDDVLVNDQVRDTGVDKKGEILMNKTKYFGQQEGRKFLEKLRVRSGLQMISPEEAVPQTTLHSKNQLPRLGTLVYGKSVPMGLYNLEHIPFTRVVKKRLQETFEKEMALGIETFSWPSILRGRHVIGIGRPGLENTLAYIPPLLTLLSDKKFYISVPRGTGPLAIIVAPTWKKVQEVYDVVESFIGTSVDGNRQIKCIPLYAGGTENDHATHLAMMKGYEILITTPNSLLRKVDDKVVNLRRVCHLVIDDVDVLLSRFMKETERIMEIFLTCVKARGDSSIPQQILIFSKIWSSDIDSFRLRFTEEPVVAFSSRVEASVYGEVRQVVTLSAWGQRLEKFCSLVDRMSVDCQKVVAWTSDVSEAVEMSKALSSQGIYTLLVHHEFDSEELMDEVKLRWHQASQSKNLTVLVSTDPCYEDLGITDATTVIHYDIPTRTRFGNRLACMYQNFSDRMSNLQPSAEPVSHIILTEKCPAHARSLFSLLKRCKSTYPRQLEDFVKGYQWGLQNEYGTELCPLLKAFGSCQNDRCELRHAIVPDLDFKTGETTINDLPASGEVKLKVIHVVNSTRLYCHLLQHRPLDGHDFVDMKLALQSLVLELSVFYSKPSNHVPYLPSDDLFEDGLCGFKDETRTVDRAKVLEMKEGTNRQPMKQCKVWLVDLGIHRFGTVDQLVKLPRRSAEMPYQAVEIFLCRVKPVDHDLEWTKKADIFIENLVKDKELIGRIVLRLGMTLWLDPLVHQVKLKGVGAANDLVIRQELLVNNLATLNPDHIKALYDLCRGKTEIPENIMIQYFDYCLEIEMTQETLPSTQEFHEINMVGIFSPGLFYVQRWDKMDGMNELELQIEEEINKTMATTESNKSNVGISLKPGSVCLAQSDGKWFRAKILSAKEDGCVNVFHLDYGTQEEATLLQICPLRRHLARFPCQAIECEVAFVRSNGEEWPPGVIDVMCNFAQYIDEVQKCLVAKVISRVDSLHTMGQKLVVDVKDASGVTLSEELAWRHKAVSGDKEKENEIKPLFGKPALKNQLFFNPLDKIPYLCANIYWCQDAVQAFKQAVELQELLVQRQKGWDNILEERDLLKPVVKLIGYVPHDKVNGIVMQALVACCKESTRLCQVAVDEYLAFTLNYCIEMVDRFAIQTQALEAVNELLSEECFLASAVACELKRTLTTFLHCHHSFPFDCQHLHFLCNAVAKFLDWETDSQVLDDNCDSLLHLVRVSTSVHGCGDETMEPWLHLLAAISDTGSHRAQRQILREKNINHVISLFDQVKSPQCLFHLLNVLQSLVERDRKNKTILLEHNALVILKRLLTRELDYPVRYLCEAVCSSLNLSFPPPETLAGTRLLPGDQEEKTVAPMVTWTESCFRVKLKIRVKNATRENFTISRNSLQCNVVADGERNVLDWELYDDVLPEQSNVVPKPFYTYISLRKNKQGKWGHLLHKKAKPFNLSADFERLLNSDEEAEEGRGDDDEEGEDGESFFRTHEKKKGIFDGLPAVRLGRLSSEDSSSHDSLVLNSSDNDHNEPKIDYEAFFHNYKKDS